MKSVNGVIAKYLLPYSKCTPFNYLFHVHHCDTSVLFHCVPQDGGTALICASLNGHTDVVQLLLSTGAQVDLQSKVRHNINLGAMSLCIADAVFNLSRRKFLKPVSIVLCSVMDSVCNKLIFLDTMVSKPTQFTVNDMPCMIWLCKMTAHVTII